ncbi:hypothetical protein [Fodinibius sp.]
MNTLSYIMRETEKDMSKTRKLYREEAASQDLRLSLREKDSTEII